MVTAINRGNEDDLELVQDAINFKAPENEEQEDDIWYDVMIYVIRTKLWFFWPIICLADVGGFVYFIVTDAQHNLNIFVPAFLYLNSFSSIMMTLFWVKQVVVEK